MNTFWQSSSLIILTVLLTLPVQAQESGRRTWKSYFPTQQQQVSAEAESEETQLAPVVTKSAGVNRYASYYDDGTSNEIPAAPESYTAARQAEADVQPFDPGMMQSDMGYPGCCDSCQLNDGCGNVCCCCPTKNFARIEYLMWWGRGRALPPLVTTSFDGTPMVDAGVLGEPSTTILYGNNDVGTDWRSGGRLTVGRQLDAEGLWTAVGRFYGLGESTDSFHAESAAGSPILARPFFNVLIAQQDALLVAFPGVSTDGVIDVRSSSSMLGADAMLRRYWTGDQNWQVDLLGGYQFSRLDDNLTIRNSELVLLDPQGIFPANTTVAMRDQFRTKNEFHGGAIGLNADFYRGPWKFSMLGKMALGNQRQSVSIDGNTVITPQVGPVTNSPVGLLARSTNIGDYSRDVFTFMPEANFTLAYQQNNWTFSVGYSFLYWNDVAWAGDQVDLRVNLSDPVIGDQLPAFAFQDTDFWLQGISFGAEYNF
ncbi:BBP7 family outer membrane beta-barrel protein [Anatilimnocola sp. NA78]|uniref:BBP7 family outer membrane beta-barrel protein n=1 Tax=Anatilimnocola sp. NA78 TaxID=3415683 RepID=UPI003CE484D2